MRRARTHCACSILSGGPSATKLELRGVVQRRSASPTQAVSAETGLLGLVVVFCLAQGGSLFAADAWGDVTFVAGEARNPRRDIALAMLFGMITVISLYPTANIAYLVLLPFERIQNAPNDRVATAALEVIFVGVGAAIMAVVIMISTSGCNNGMILTGVRVCFTMARDGLLFRSTGRLSARHVPAGGDRGHRVPIGLGITPGFPPGISQRLGRSWWSCCCTRPRRPGPG